MHLIKRALLLIVVALLLIPVVAQAANPHLPKGVRLLNRAEDERALAAFLQALRFKRSTPREITQTHLYLGITYFNLFRQKEAARHFRLAFQRNPDLHLPSDASPKTAEFAEAIRAAVKAQNPIKPPPATQPVVAKPRTVPPPATAAAPLARAPRRTVNWPAWSMAGLAVVASGTGLALALVARSNASDANNLDLPSREADAKHDSAAKKALGANILFGIAGAAAITSAVLFLVLREERRRPPATAAVAPLPSGAMVQVRGALW